MDNTKTFTFDGQTSSTYGVFISGDSVYNAPPRSYELVDIPGRNGQLVIDYGRFENIEVTYPAFIIGDDQSTFATKVSDFRNMICSRIGYKKLSDTYHSNEFRMAIYQSGLEVEPTYYNGVGQFELTFNCKPQRFLTSGETKTTLTSGNAINNPTLFPSKPLFEVVGSGTLTVGTIAIAISESGTKYIDCDTMECYAISGGIPVSKNDKIALTDFPELAPGNTTISWTGLTSVKCTPRWWKL